MFEAVHEVISQALYQGAATPDQIQTLLGGMGVGGNVQQLLTTVRVVQPHSWLLNLCVQILQDNVPRWKEASVEQCVSLPKFLEIDWRVDVMTASGDLSRMAVPTALVDLKVVNAVSALLKTHRLIGSCCQGARAADQSRRGSRRPPCWL
jgi:hypothetical protein